MTTKTLPVLLNPSEAYTDEVLKCIRDTLKKKSGEINRRYEAEKTFSRNDQTFVTTISDEEKAWREKFERRKNNLTHGFFADKAKPYQSVGTVYLEAGDLMLSSITDDLRSKIKKTPRHFKETWKSGQPKKMTTLQKKALAFTPVNEPLEVGEATAGFMAIKQRIEEVNTMRRGVQAEQSLLAYINKKEMETGSLEKKEELEMKAPYKNNWKIVRTIGKILGATKTREGVDLKAVSGTGSVVSKAFRNTGMKRMREARINQEMNESMEDKEEVLQRWRHEVKQKYLIKKLQSINSLFCALFNMKAKILKMNNLLTDKTVKDLLRSEVVIDNYNRPTAWRAQFQQGQDDHPDTADSDKFNPHQGQANRKRMSSISIGVTSYRRPRLAQLASKLANKSMTPPGPKIETWDELMSAGEKAKCATPKPGTPSTPNSKYSMKLHRRRDTTTMTPNAIPPDATPPWMMIAQYEKAISEKKRLSLGSSAKRNAEDLLNDIRTDFIKLQKKLSKDMNEELRRKKHEQHKLVHNKMRTIQLGPIINVSLDKMRGEAKAMLKDMKDSSARPEQWYVDLKNEIRAETCLRNETINSILKKVSRFKFENELTIPFAKEKLCILVMSMPVHLLLTNGMRDAIIFILEHSFGAPAEIFESWLVARRLDAVNAALKTRIR